MALSGLFSGLEHGGRQMWGSNTQGLLDPKHGKDVKVDYLKMVDSAMRECLQLGER
jgi:hypothetical protein